MGRGPVDGSIIIDTKIDTDGMEKDAKGASSKVIDLKNKVSSTSSAVKNLRSELEKTGNTKVKTKLAESIEKDIGKAQSKLNELDWQAEEIINKKRAEFGISINDDATLDDFLRQDKEWQKLQEQIEGTERKLAEYKQKLTQVENAAPLTKDTAEYRQKEQRLGELSGQLEVYKAKLRETEQAEQKSVSQTASSSSKVDDLKKRLNKTVKALNMIKNGAKRAGSTLKKAFSGTVGKAVSSIGNHLKKSNKSANVFEKSLRRIKNSLVRMFFFRRVHSPIDAVKDGLGEISKISPEVNANLSNLKSSSDYLKNSFAALAAPLVNLLTPAFVRFIDITAEATNRVTALISSLTGSGSYTKATKVWKDYAQSLDDSTGSLKDNTEAAKENQKGLAGYDELNVMTDDSSTTSSSSSQTSQPAFENVQTQVDGLEKSLLSAIKGQNWNAVGELFGDKINSALGKIKWSKIKKTVKNWGSNIAGIINGFLKETDWNKVGNTAAEAVNTVISFVLGFSYDFDWKLFGQSLKQSLVSFFENLDTRGAVDAFDSIVNGLIETGLELVGDPEEWEQWGSDLEQNISDAISGISWGNVKTLFWNLLSGIFNFSDGFFGSLLDDIDKQLDSKDFTQIGKNLSKSLEEADWDKLVGEDSLIGHIFKTAGNALVKLFDFLHGFLSNPKSAESLATGFETLVGNVPWKEILIKGITSLLFDLPMWITTTASKLIGDFCDGLATGFQNGEDDNNLRNAALTLIESLGNLMITGTELLLNMMTSNLLNAILGLFKLIANGALLIMKGVLGDEWYERATSILWNDNFKVPRIQLPRISIPKFATGTVVPANYGEFLAVLGDNKRETEVVSPLSTIEQAVEAALSKHSFGSSQDSEVINLYIGEDKLFSWIVKKNDSYKKSHGASALA